MPTASASSLLQLDGAPRDAHADQLLEKYPILPVMGIKQIENLRARVATIEPTSPPVPELKR